jgi:hypothetical protein
MRDARASETTARGAGQLVDNSDYDGDPLDAHCTPGTSGQRRAVPTPARRPRRRSSGAGEGAGRLAVRILAPGRGTARQPRRARGHEPFLTSTYVSVRAGSAANAPPTSEATCPLPVADNGSLRMRNCLRANSLDGTRGEAGDSSRGPRRCAPLRARHVPLACLRGHGLWGG